MAFNKTWEELTSTERRLLGAADVGTELGHITLPERVYREDGTFTHRPALDPAECSKILLDWFDEGLVTVHRVPDNVDVTVEEARALIGDKSRWGFSEGVSLTDKGNETFPTRST